MDFVSEYEKFVPKDFPKQLVESAINYMPNENDLLIASYLKCGTTWTQQIVYLLLNRGVPPNTTILFSKSIPFLEFCNPKSQQLDECKPRAFKTHLPFHLIRFNESAKYIYCVRNPKDCCVSFWFHEKDFPLLNCNDFNQFFNVFMEGNTGYGDYFDHLLGWFQQKQYKNILFLHFEDLINDFETQLNRIGSFISNDLYSQLINDKEFRESVIKFSSFEFMKETTNKQMKTFFEMSVQEMQNDEQILDGFKDAFSQIKDEQTVNIAPEVNFIRKGVIGDHKTYFTEKQNEVMNKKIREKIGNISELINKWKEFI